MWLLIHARVKVNPYQWKGFQEHCFQIKAFPIKCVLNILPILTFVWKNVLPKNVLPKKVTNHFLSDDCPLTYEWVIKSDSQVFEHGPNASITKIELKHSVKCSSHSTNQCWFWVRCAHWFLPGWYKLWTPRYWWRWLNCISKIHLNDIQ